MTTMTTPPTIKEVHSLPSPSRTGRSQGTRHVRRAPSLPGSGVVFLLRPSTSLYTQGKDRPGTPGESVEGPVVDETVFVESLTENEPAHVTVLQTGKSTHTERRTLRRGGRVWETEASVHVGETKQTSLIMVVLQVDTDSSELVS